MQSNISVLPFYSSVDRQVHRKWYAYGQIYPLLTPSRFILPFQIRTALSGLDLAVELYDKNGTYIEDITVGMQDTGLAVIDNTTYRIIAYPGALPFSVNVIEGQYYLKISDATQSFYAYSELFTFSNDLSKCLKIEYWDKADFEANDTLIDYTPPYKSRLYVSADISKPDYEEEEEVIKRDGYSFFEKQISYKKYRFTFLAPEFLCDAMRIIRMHDNITITDQYGDAYAADTFLTSVKWDEAGYLAVVDAEFTSDTVIKKNGVIRTLGSASSFNIDFNEDFES